MAEAIVGPLLNKLQEVVVTEGKALAGVGREIDRLREKLMWLQALVHETELRSRSDGNKQIRVLACQMRTVAFEAEDAVDRFFLEADLSRFGRHRRLAARLFLANFATQLRVRFVLSRKITSMNARLEDIVDNSAKYSCSNAGSSTDNITWRASRSLPPLRHNWDDLDLQESNEPTKGSSAKENPVVKEKEAELEDNGGSPARSERNKRDDSDLEESNKPKGKKANPTKGSPAVKEDNGSATKRTTKRKEKGSEESKLKTSPTKGNSSADKQDEHQADKSEEEKIKEAKLKRKQKKTDLKELLLDEKEGGSFVIYVVGESGMGKRYLIKKAYKDATINKKFEVCIWASFPPDTSDIADQIKEKLKEKCSKLQPGKKKLYQVKYLVVVDCPMSSAMLGSIIEQCPQGAAGSKIVVIATSSPSEKNCGIIKLSCLDGGKSLKLFNNTIGLHGRRKSAYKTGMMNKVRDHIEEITNGLPLAVILLAKLMRTMDYNKWEDASTYIMNNNQDDLLKTIISMGIDDLPDELKSCLLYMAGFLERSTMDAVQLVRLWMAEGFLTQNLGVEPEELGQRYLKELIFRGLVELEKKKEDEDAVESVSIRDQIHRFFRWEAQRTGFMETHNGGSAPVPGSARRLALNSRKLPKPDKMKGLKKLRTVMSHSPDGHEYQEAQGSQSFKRAFPELLRNSIFLRVISLEGVDIGKELPTHIGKLLHLQYLAVRCPTLTTIPDTIGKLKRLQIMDVRGTKVKSLPDSFWNIKSLRHVLSDDNMFSFPPTSQHFKASP